MEISNSFSVSGAQALRGPSRGSSPQETESATETTPLAPVDQLDLSPEAQSLGQAIGADQSSSDIRTDKVAALRRAIADGSYETPEKLSFALDRLIDQIG